MKYSITHSRLLRKIRRKKEQLSHLLHSTRYRFQKIKSLQDELNQLTRQGQKKLKYTLGILSISAFMGQYSLAQNIEKTMFHKPVPFHEWQGFPAIAIGSSTFLKPDLVDIDGDGDFDLFLGNHKGLLFYENKGDRSNPIFIKEDAQWEPFNFQKPFDNPALETSFVDLDDDGDYDLLCSVYEYGDVYYYENVGDKYTPEFKEPVQNPFGFENPAEDPFEYSTNSTDIVDLDNDGDFDIISVDYYGDFFYYENVGDNKTPSFDSPRKNDLGLTVEEGYTQDSNWEGSVTFNDIDRDGDLDIFVGTWFRNTVFFENYGTVCSPKFGEGVIDPFGLSYLKELRREALAFADLDGDGQDEVLITGTGNNEIYYYDIDHVQPKMSSLVGCEIDTLISVTTCNEYDFNGQIISESGLYRDTLKTIAGADSIIGLQLHVSSLLSEIRKEDEFLIATTEGASYQWYRSLNNGFLKLHGETNPYFIPHEKGNYFVEVSNNVCEAFSSDKTIEETVLNVEAFPQRYAGITNGKGHFDQKEPILSSTYKPSQFPSDTRFSYEIISDGEMMIVSEPLDDFDSASVNLVETGSISLYTKNDNQWEFQEKIYAPYYKNDVNQFGRSIDMDDEHVIVGAPFVYFPSDSDYFHHRGAVFIYSKSNEGSLVLEQSIISPINQLYSNFFGMSVKVKNDVAVIAGDKFTFIYRYNVATTSWDLEETLEINKRVNEIGIRENQVILLSDVILVYNKHGNNWNQDQVFNAPEGKIIRGEIEGDQMIVSSYNPTKEGEDEVYVYTVNNENAWSKETRFMLPENDSKQSPYGTFVQINDQYALVGSKNSEHTLMNGKVTNFPDVHVYYKSNDTWNYHHALVYEHDSTSSPVASIELSNNEIFIGGYNKDIINYFTLDDVESWEYRNLDCGTTYWADSLITYAPQDIFNEETTHHVGVLGLPKNIYIVRVEAINEYLFDGKIPLTETGNYTFTLENELGCDSIVALDLMIYEEADAGLICDNATEIKEDNYYKVLTDNENSYYSYTAFKNGTLKVSTCGISQEDVVMELFKNCDLMIEKSYNRCFNGGTYVEVPLSEGDNIIINMNNEDVGEDYFFEVTFEEQCFTQTALIHDFQSSDCAIPMDVMSGVYKVTADFGSGWYRYHAFESGDLRISTVGMTYLDTKIELYSDCQTMISSNDDFSHLQSEIVHSMNEGEEVLIHMSDQYIQSDYIFSLSFQEETCYSAYPLSPNTQLAMQNRTDLVQLTADNDGQMIIEASEENGDFTVYSDLCKSSILATTCDENEKLIIFNVNNGDTFYVESINEVAYSLSYRIEEIETPCLPKIHSLYINACDFYIYENDTLTETGDYQYIEKGEGECDDVITILNLTINKDCEEKCESFIEESITDCHPFKWHNQWISESGIYFDTLRNDCNTVYQLTVNINSEVKVDSIQIEKCEMFVIGDIEIIESGIYYDTLTYETGCDSVINVYDVSILNEEECQEKITRLENPEDVKINVFPIPSNEKINVHLPKTVSKLIIDVYTINGQQRSHSVFNNTDRGDVILPGERGIYLLCLYCDNQKYPIVQKVIKN
ncbi:FG-GAP-like repeat-containing protein [Flammeovirga sp. SubArs3]|uniref:FG-GAP-like repeat-containing protein n=1 Tax=Flammeovirga sp. SubArs3 TaxID=2995316 RepID=UPI00248D3098|nr:FG-GAP-like repeat-containing protein [Flammeovirga sp. SubArs3]